ncbi:nucleotidyltransferase family protein [Candidatus Bathyarchaeota archaeon A05DMB-2]|jgi:hypothetical protein|nr:nucleotidyltransferase family protein [Candidatus Bathyarchaeota archaeon A05DMB-2]
MEQDKAAKSSMLVRYIGIPGYQKGLSLQLGIEDFQIFLQLAEQNKIPLFFLQAATYSKSIKSTLLHYEERYKNTLDLIAYTAALLEKTRVPYALFKTLKPFPYTPSDIDVLLRSDESLQTVAETLMDHGCITLDKDNYGITLFSPRHKMNIDLTTQIAVSGLVYVDKKLVFEHLCEVKVNDTSVKTLEAPVELLVVAAHSLFKEQTFTLSDYYTFAILVQHWREAMKLAEIFHLELALEMALKTTRQVTASSFGSANALMREFTELGTINLLNEAEEREMPKKYDLSFLMLAFLRKVIEDPVSRHSLSCMARSISNPAFYGKLMQHITRRTY